MKKYSAFNLWTRLAMVTAIATLGTNSCKNSEGLFDSNAFTQGTAYFYHFDETSGSTAIDSSGNGYNGTIFGAPRVPGKVGQALQFSATGDRVEAPPPYAIFFQYQEITIDFWLNPTTLNPGDLYNLIGAFTGEMMLGLNNGKIEFQLLDSLGGQKIIITSATSLNTSTWYYVAVTFNGSDARLYINGVLDSSNSIPFLIPHMDNRLFVAGTNGVLPQFLGFIDEVRISNIVLTDTEIADYYQKTNL